MASQSAQMSPSGPLRDSTSSGVRELQRQEAGNVPETSITLKSFSILDFISGEEHFNISLIMPSLLAALLLFRFASAM